MGWLMIDSAVGGWHCRSFILMIGCCVVLVLVVCLIVILYSLNHPIVSALATTALHWVTSQRQRGQSSSLGTMLP
jgi:Flp pilus assembly protein TadB